MENNKRTLQQLAQEAMDVQDASNLCGVVQGFARAMLDLTDLYRDKGTDFIKSHFITIAWADKVNSLCGIQSMYDTEWLNYSKNNIVDVAHLNCAEAAKITEQH